MTWLPWILDLDEVMQLLAERLEQIVKRRDSLSACPWAVPAVCRSEDRRRRAAPVPGSWAG